MVDIKNCIIKITALTAITALLLSSCGGNDKIADNTTQTSSVTTSDTSVTTSDASVITTTTSSATTTTTTTTTATEITGVTTTLSESETSTTTEDEKTPERDPYYDPKTGHTYLGSSGMLDGKSAIISLFVSEPTYSWDFSNQEDAQMKDDILSYLEISADWITEQSHLYGKDATFIYDWTEHPELRYDATIMTDYHEYDNYPNWYSYSWEYIDENIDSLRIKEDLDVDNIVYILFFNCDITSDTGSYSIGYFPHMPFPYELSFVHTRQNGYLTPPGTIAHEILHQFGAADLYYENNDIITEEYATYLSDNNSNDIMFTCYDPYTGVCYYDKIVNEITDVSAYYLGWIDECDDVKEWGLGKSEHQPYIS